MKIINNLQDEPLDHYVYIHRKLTNGEIFYVGKGVSTRYKRVFGRSNFWNRVANKHGIVVEIVQDRLQEWAAHELEMELIALYGRQDLKKGSLVNLTDGGEGKCGSIPSVESNLSRSVKMKGRTISESHCRAISESNRKRTLSQSTKDKISISRKGRFSGENHPLYGKKKSKESSEKSAAKCRIKVICIETDQIFNSVSEAAKFCDGSTSGISKVCRGKWKQYKGYSWKYLENKG